MSSSRKSKNSLTFIDDINPIHDQNKIKVLILRLWKAYQRDAGNTIEMVLVDEKGSRIHATVEEKNIKKFDSVLKEGDVVTLNPFKLIKYSGDYKSNSLSFKILFYRTTQVKPCDDFPKEVPEKYFVEFGDVSNGSRDTRVFVDVIGQIVNVGPIEDIKIRGKSTPKLDVELRDRGNVRLICTLWADFAKQVKVYTEANPAAVVCVIRCAQVKEWKGNWTISNAMGATRVLLDPPGNFFCRLPTDGVVLTNHDNSELFAGSTVSIRDQFLVKNHKRTVRDIVEALEVDTINLCVILYIHAFEGMCVAMVIVGSVERTSKWYYVSCKMCNKSVEPYPENSGDDGKPPLYYCGVCDKDVSAVVFRYRLVLEVSDATNYKARFLLFDAMGSTLLRRTAQELYNAVSENDPSILPSEIGALVGRRFLFKVSIGGDNLKSDPLHYVVQLFSDDDELIKDYSDGLDSEVLVPLPVTPITKEASVRRGGVSVENPKPPAKKIKIEGKKEESFATT
ncbi:replication factor A protein 1 [Arabidopsis lyrata subsp. lyrata]|uniref:replication factor A protein 1 n=1 Tax=Arabidopsis lyrata subsp. lyrata TaxID=81972 RepID=UPI000A29A8CE|nr:replication factor A protein 1 [Arabidopsis lyrata subsp. lyrata]|eukprot:XP_020876048.1 replication factor A protein 1 [Arabidopsis lyrata subsp. lyrata]